MTGLGGRRGRERERGRASEIWRGHAGCQGSAVIIEVTDEDGEREEEEDITRAPRGSK